MSAKVFISCGQSTNEEKQTARDVETWFKTKGFYPYVAVEVNTGIPDLNRWVIEELKSSDYFVFINFAREEISSSTGSFKPFRRGSVYANQELAVAVSLGFKDRMILVNQRCAEREGIFKIMVCNTDEFDTYDKIVPIIEKSVLSAGWDNLSSRHLSVENSRIDYTPVSYYDHHLRRLLYIAHIDVRNSRPDIPAADCEIRLVKIESPSRGERPSPDRNALKVTGSERAYAQNIWQDDLGTFDLFGIDAFSYPDTYLLSRSDVTPRSAIISTREKHILTYEILAKGFPQVTAKIALDFGGSMPTTSPRANISEYSGSGYPQTISVVSSNPSHDHGSYPFVFGDPDSTPKVTIKSVDRSY